MSKTSYALRLRVLIGLAAFLLLAFMAGSYGLRALRLSEQNFERLGQLSQLDAALPALLRSATNYIENAPRDYESYSRDVAVFLHDIRNDIDDLQQRLAALETELAANLGLALPRPLMALTGSDDAHEVLLASSADVRERWDTFRAGFDEAMGPDEAEPRLEWGAEYIVENADALGTSVSGLSNAYRSFLAEQRRLVESVLQWMLGALVVAGLVGVAWFYRRVIGRIGATAQACAHVANGEFGYAIKVEGNDELSELSRAFNTVSSRSQLVVRMLTELQRAQSHEQWLQVVVNASGIYLPIAWTAIVRADLPGSLLTVTHALPAASTATWGRHSLTTNDDFGRLLADSLVSGKPVLINDVKEYATRQPEGSLIRDLARTTRLQALAAIPFVVDGAFEGLLMFGSRSSHYRPDQTELLGNMAPTMAVSLSRLAA